MEQASYRIFLSDNTSQFSLQNNQSDGKTSAISANFRFEWKLDSLTTIMYRPTFNFSKGNSNSGNFSETLNNESTPINRKEATNHQTNDRFSTNGSLQLNRKLNSKGRNIALRLYYDLDDGNSDRYSLSNTYYLKYGDSIKTLNQWIEKLDKNNKYQVQITYMEPVFTNRFIEINYSYQHRSSLSENMPMTGINKKIHTVNILTQRTVIATKINIPPTKPAYFSVLSAPTIFII